MIREKEFLQDYNTGRNMEEAQSLKWWILNHLRVHGAATADEIYEKSGCGDIAMYLILHELKVLGLIQGPDPYDEEMRGTKHTDWLYTLGAGSGAKFFAAMSAEMSKDWDPEKWTEGTVLPGDSTAN